MTNHYFFFGLVPAVGIRILNGSYLNAAYLGVWVLIGPMVLGLMGLFVSAERLTRSGE